ncbi:hypothetical protein UA08_02094 [Talaromyces atroroseus]|uniref:Uncharacterized protein n=1 Tax=Talaromyces atroroseus TaxID=1441469 RepID=A0A1Q5QBZ4_TALAT|nr:hypothetical protein UA08_02094 [Talaromyces atroroseus]OKL63401.1 hypothetical protein UA08_02094 [Talaromyces atroroseus]
MALANLADDDSTLHYHVTSRGNGHRHPNFIQLWKTGPDQVGEFYDQTLLTLAKNILEMILCMAFRSLPPTVLQEYFELLNVQHSTMLGLNIVPPLYQTVSLGQEVRRSFMILCEESVDSDIKEWPTVRSSQQKKRWDPAKTPRVLTSENYVEAMKEAAEENHHLRRLKIPVQGTPPGRKSGNFEEWFARLCDGLENMLSDNVPRQIPFGSLEAKIGVIFDQVFRKETMDETTGLPYGIRRSGFNETNVLAWPWSFRQYTSADACRPISAITKTEVVLLRNYTKDVIARSCLQVVILCGNNAAGILLTEHLKNYRINIKLSHGTIEAYVETLDGVNIQRLYLKCPTSMLHVLIGTDEQIYHITRLFHFATRWTKTPHISPYFLDNSRAIIRLVRLRGAEKKGAAPMTPDNIHPAIRVWLARKGFTDDQAINDLASKGVTLVHACLILARFASRCPVEFRVNTDTPVGPVAARKKGGPKRIASEQQIEEIKELYRRVSADETEDAIVEPLVSVENSPENHKSAATWADNSTGIRAKDNSPTNQLTTPKSDQGPHVLTTDTRDEGYESQGSEANSEAEDNYGANEGYENFQIGGVNVENLDQALELAEEISATVEEFTITINKQGQSCVALAPKPKPKSGHSIRRWSSTGPSSAQVRRTIASLRTGREYPGHWVVPEAKKETARRTNKQPKTKKPKFIIFVHSMLRLVITDAPMEGQRGKALVEFEFAEGRHDKVWALAALDTDPCRRLAIRVTLSYENGNAISFYPQTQSQGAPYKANSAMDWMDGDNDEVIASRPRRFVFIQSQTTDVPEHLQKFVMGGYTDTLGRYFKSFPRGQKRKLGGMS